MLIPAARFVCFALTAPAMHGACSLALARVRGEYRVDPLGIDSPILRADWLL